MQAGSAPGANQNSFSIDPWISRSGTEVQMHIGNVPESATPNIFERIEKRGALGTANPELRAFALGLHGYEFARGVSANKEPAAKAEFIANALAEIRSGAPIALLIEGPCAAYYITVRRTETGGAGSAHPFAFSGALVERAEMKFGNAEAPSQFTLVQPLSSIVDSAFRGNSHARAGWGLEHPESPTDGNGGFVSGVHALVEGSDRQAIRFHLNSKDEYPAVHNRSVNVLADAAGVEVSVLRRRETSAGLERLVTEHGFVEAAFTPDAEVTAGLGKLGYKPNDIKFVLHKESGVIIGMPPTGTDLFVHLPQEKFPYPLLASEAAQMLDFPDERFNIQSVWGDVSSLYLHSREADSLVYGNDFRVAGLEPYRFDEMVIKLTEVAGRLETQQGERQMQETLAREALAREQAIAKERADARERVLTEAEAKVRELLPSALRDIGQSSQVVAAMLAPLNVTAANASYGEFLALMLPRGASQEAIALIKDQAALRAAQAAVLDESMVREFDDRRANTRVFQFAHEDSGLMVTIAAVKTSLVGERVHYEVGFKSADGGILTARHMEALARLDVDSRNIDGSVQMGPYRARSSAERVLVTVKNPVDLVRFFADLKVEPSTPALTA